MGASRSSTCTSSHCMPSTVLATGAVVENFAGADGDDRAAGGLVLGGIGNVNAAGENQIERAQHNLAPGRFRYESDGAEIERCLHACSILIA